MNKKLIILLLLIICVISAIIIVKNSTLKSKNKADIVLLQEEKTWKSLAPEIFSNIGYTKLIESPIKVVKDHNRSNSQEKIFGTITNPFGIRDDVLLLILKVIPAKNEQSRIAAMKMAYYAQQQIGVTDQNKLIAISDKMGAAIGCMDNDSTTLIQQYDKLLRNTPEGSAEQDRIERLLSNNVLVANYGIKTNDHQRECEYFLSQAND